MEIEKQEPKKNLDLDEKEIEKEAMDEIRKEYEAKRDELKNEILELKKKEKKEEQRKKLASYCKNKYDIDLPISEEQTKEEQLRQTEKVLEFLKTL